MLVVSRVSVVRDVMRLDMCVCREPGRAERKQFADSVARVELARKKLGRSYCHLVLGVGLPDAHHMGCGRSVSIISLYQTHSHSSLMFAVAPVFNNCMYIRT